jgi:subtilisin-like proprotein convertase family protein
MPDLRRLILLSVVSALAALLLVAAPASATTQSFANTGPIKIPASGESGAGTPYPSSVVVNGLPGPITDVNVTLHGVGHTFPADIGVLLVSPSGDTVKVMRGNCGVDDIEDFTWILDQQAATPMPTTSSCPEFVYRPNPNPNPGFGEEFPSPAPPGPHGVSLNDFNGENANGTWRLYVADFGTDDTGDMERGWTLTVTTGPVDVAIPGTGTSGAANPYPATRTISGHTGVISDLNVAIEGIWHQRPDDLDLLLVGPQGEKVTLMSDACGTSEVAAFGWAWSDEAAVPMPDGDATNSCGTTIHRPADYEPGESWPAPAPPGPHATALSAFDGTDPNGEWRLFVNDDADGATGFFTNRFQLQLQINTKPTITPLKPAPGSKTRDRTPLISAKVSDAQTELAQNNITLFVDNRPKAAFAYSQSTDTLTYKSTKLKAGKRHTVRIEADDGVLSTTRSWSFKVIRRR